MIPRRTIKPYAEHLEPVGIPIEDVSTTAGVQFKLLVTFVGNRRFFIVANSSSDHRAFLNWKSDVRKWVRGLSQ